MQTSNDREAVQHSRHGGWRVEQLCYCPVRKGHYEDAVIDRPWTYHAPKLILW